MTVQSIVSRDYITEMNDFIQANEPTGDVALPIFASALINTLQTTDPDLLNGWLQANAEHLFRETIRRRWTHTRNPEQVKRGIFNHTVRSGGVYQTEKYYIQSIQTWRPVGAMTASDHYEVAQGYRAQTKQASVRQAFHEAVAKKITQVNPLATTSAALTQADYLALWTAMVP